MCREAKKAGDKDNQWFCSTNLKERLKNYALTGGSAPVKITTNNRTITGEQWTGLVRKDAMALSLQVKKDLRYWETSNNGTTKEMFYEIRGDPGKDLWQNAWNNLW